MKPAFDNDAIRLTLKRAVENGHFTLEQLDQPSAGFQACARVDRAHFPKGYEGIQHRNLLRDGQGPSQPHRGVSQDVLDSEAEPTNDDCPF